MRKKRDATEIYLIPYYKNTDTGSWEALKLF